MCYPRFIPATIALFALASSTFAEGPPAKRTWVAILPLKNLSGNPEDDFIGPGVAEELTTRLSTLPQLELVETLQIKAALQEQDFQHLDITDKDTVVRIGKLIGVQRLLIGSYQCDQDRLVFNAHIVDVETGLVLHTASWRGQRADVLDGAVQLANAVIESFDKGAVIVEGQAAVVSTPTERLQVTPEQRKQLDERGTTSLEAWEAFSKGNAATDQDEKIGWYTLAIKADARYAWANNNCGIARGRKGDYNGAIAGFDQAIHFKPDFALAYYNRGVVYGKKGDKDRAITDYDKAIQLKPDYAAAYNNRGVAYGKKGDNDRAITDYDKAIQLEPDYAEAYNNRSIAYDEKGDYDRAVADCNKAIQIEPNYAEAYNNRGFAYDDKGDYDRAIADYDKAIELKPDNAAAYNNRGIAYGHKGDHDRAVADFDKAIQLTPDFAPAYYLRGKAYQKLRRYALALKDLEAAQRLGLKVDAKLLAEVRELAKSEP